LYIYYKWHVVVNKSNQIKHHSTVVYTIDKSMNERLSPSAKDKICVSIYSKQKIIARTRILLMSYTIKKNETEI